MAERLLLCTCAALLTPHRLRRKFRAQLYLHTSGGRTHTTRLHIYIFYILHVYYVQFIGGKHAVWKSFNYLSWGSSWLRRGAGIRLRIVTAGARSRALGLRLGGELPDDPLLGGRGPGHALVACRQRNEPHKR